MASRKHVLLFPHEHADLLGAVHELNVRAKTRPQLRTLLTAASAVAHEQAVALNGPERASLGEFEDLIELAERHVSQDGPSVVAEMVLFTTIQIGQLLVYVDRAPHKSKSS